MCSLQNEFYVLKNKDPELFCKYYMENLKHKLLIPILKIFILKMVFQQIF